MTKHSASTESSFKQYIEQPRMRMIKPQLMKHELMSELELKTQLPFKFAFMGIFFFCNRSGCFRWQPIRLRAEIFPHLPNIDFKAILDTFEEVGMMIKYQHEGQFYGCIPTWAKHQRIPESEPETDIPCLDPRTGEIFFESEQSEEPPPKTTEPPSPASSEELASEPLPMEGMLLPADLKPIPEDAVQSPSAIVCHAPSNGTQGDLVVLKSVVLGKEGKGKGWGGRGSVSGSGSGRGRGSERGSRSIKTCVLHPTTVEATQQVFENWKTVMGYLEANLDPKRQKLIGNALRWGYSVEALCEAIQGCALTPHNQGHNDRGERYDSLKIILRSADQIDRFRRNYRTPPRILDESERKLQASVQSVQTWLNTESFEDHNERH